MTVAMSSTAESKEEKEEPMGHAGIIESSVGSCRRWQIRVFLFAFLVNLPLAMQELSITIISPPADFECSNNTFDKCSKDCPSLVWNKEIFSNTIVMEWELVCERTWIDHFAQTILMLGIFTGNLGFGFLADRYGRRRPLVAAVIIEAITGITLAFVPSLWSFLLFRYLVAVAAGGTLCTAFVIVVEVIGKQYRAICGILFQMQYYIGQSLLGLIGYLIRDWRYMQLTISLPVCFLIIYYWVIPEPPRYLLSVGRLEDAIEVLEKAAKVNKMPVEPIRPRVMNALANKSYPKASYLDLWRTPHIRHKTICIYINWTILGLCFFGVAQYIGELGGNIFINISAAGFIQIPGNALIIYTIERWGRKLTVYTTYAMCSISCLCIAFAPKEPTWIMTILGCLSMAGISLSFATMFVWSGEIFATPVRNVGMGSAATCAKIGSMTAPFLFFSEPQWITPLIFGIAALIAIAAAFFLPETLHGKMPDSIEEAEKYGRKYGSYTARKSSAELVTGERVFEEPPRSRRLPE